MWVTLGGPLGEKSILFEYDPSRNGELPLRLLDGFTGYLQTDGYTGYNAVCAKNGNTQLGCWDHARRKFKDAQNAQPKPKKGKTKKITKADRIFSHINTLYLIERQIKERSITEKYQQRQLRSLPVLNKLKLYLENNQHKVPKDSLTPNQRHQGLDVEILKNRKSLYQQKRNEHPERWSGEARNWEPEGAVEPNPEQNKWLLKKLRRQLPCKTPV